MSNDKLKMSNQCQITKAKILLIWSDTAKFNRSDTAKYTRVDTTCGVNDRTSAVNPVSQPINETEFIFRYFRQFRCLPKPVINELGLGIFISCYLFVFRYLGI
jgi:hypothetical protein